MCPHPGVRRQVVDFLLPALFHRSHVHAVLLGFGVELFYAPRLVLFLADASRGLAGMAAHDALADDSDSFGSHGRPPQGWIIWRHASHTLQYFFKFQNWKTQRPIAKQGVRHTR